MAATSMKFAGYVIVPWACKTQSTPSLPGAELADLAGAKGITSAVEAKTRFSSGHGAWATWDGGRGANPWGRSACRASMVKTEEGRGITTRRKIGCSAVLHVVNRYYKVWTGSSNKV